MVQKMLEESQKECKALQKQVIGLKQNLQDAQDFIFSLQPRQQSLTEKGAAEEFKSLCASIEEFVGRKLGDALDDRILIKYGGTGIPFKPAKELLDLIPCFGKDAFERRNTDEYNITAAVLQFLRHEIFDQRYYTLLGDAKLVSFMKSVETGMKNIEPRQGQCLTSPWTFTLLQSM